MSCQRLNTLFRCGLDSLNKIPESGFGSRVKKASDYSMDALMDGIEI